MELPLLGKLPSDWRVVEFGSVISGGTRNGIYKKKEFHGNGDKIVNMGELFAHPRLFAVPMKRVQLSESEQQRFRLQVGDLLFARRSLVAEGAGKCSIVCKIDEATTFESSIIRARPNPKIADSFYLYYLFRSPYGVYILDSILRHVAVAGITGTDLVKLLIPLPPLPEQKAIAHILGTLDDKIELNQQMNQTLEAIARAIFKSWFVDFDPVRAKMEGRQPAGMDAATADLFPDEFEDSQLGKIPKGWRVGTLDDITELILGGDWGKDTPSKEASEPAYCIRGADIPELQNAGLGKMPIRYLKPSSIQKRSLQPGDIVIEISGGSPTQSTGRSVLIATEILGRLSYPLVCSNFCRLVRLTKDVTPICIYLWLQWLYESDAFLQYENGTTGIKNFAYTVFSKEYDLIIPPLDLLMCFDMLVSNLLKKRQANGLHSETLAAIRDTLLPKLLSGEIRVRDADKVVEVVT